MGIYPVALTSASLKGARYFGFFSKQFHAAHDRNLRLPAHTNQRGYGHFSHHEVSSRKRCRPVAVRPELVRVTLHRASTPRACPRSTRARKLSLTRVVRYVTHVCLPCAHIARASRASRGAVSVRCYPELPCRERTPKATTRETSPRRARAGVARERREPPRFRGLARRVCSFALFHSHPGGI